MASSQHLFTTTQSWPQPRPGAETSSAWLIGGIWLETDDAGLHIFNALDENGLSNNPVAINEAQRVVPLGRDGS